MRTLQTGAYGICHGMVCTGARAPGEEAFCHRDIVGGVGRQQPVSMSVRSNAVDMIW